MHTVTIELLQNPTGRCAWFLTSRRWADGLVDVLLATGIFAPDIGGPATHSALLLAELPRRRWGVRLVTYGPAGVSRRIPKGLRHLAYLLLCLRRALHADLILAQDTVSSGLPALLAARILGRPLVVRVPGDYAWEQAVQRFGVTDTIDAFQSRRYDIRTEMLRAVQRWVVRTADAVITPSEYFRGLVARWIGRTDGVHVVYGSSQLREPKPAASGDDNGVLIVTAGRLVPWKGVATLVELVAQHPDWRLVVAGDGPQAAELRARARQLGAPVEFTGALSQDALSDRLRGATVFVLNTTFESFPHQILEAMHVGVPVVASRIGGIPELIDDGKEGILVQPNDKDQMAAAITRLVRDRDVRQAIIVNARAKAKQFSIDRMVEGTMEVCRTAVARRENAASRVTRGDRPSAPG